MTFINTVKKHGAKALAVAGLSLLASNASAALPAAIGTSLTEVQADGLALADLVWPVIIAIFGAILLMKLFKRFASKI